MNPPKSLQKLSVLYFANDQFKRDHKRIQIFQFAAAYNFNTDLEIYPLTFN